MADPTIQTFCCYHGNGTDVAMMVMKGFNTDVYNIICVISATLGILGAIYQILPRQEYVYNHQWISITAIRGRNIIVWLALSDLLASIGVLTRSSIWLTNKSIMPDIEEDSSVWFCGVTSAWTQYFYISTWVWTLCYTIDTKLVLYDKMNSTKYYHLAAWLTPAFLTAVGLSLLYFPDAQCHTSKSLSTAIFRILPNYLATYLPMTIVMIANPILYKSATKDMRFVIMTRAGQFTNKEREMLDSIKTKFLMINLVFYVCWLPNIINGILIWVLWFQLPSTIIIAVWYLMALLNPLQALLNCLVYRRWNRGSERLVKPWQMFQKLPEQERQTTKSPSQRSKELTSEECVPLLESTPRASINGYS